MDAPENPPAFPGAPCDANSYAGHAGMTLRDWFAGQMIGQCVHNALSADGSWEPANVAHHAYLVADALLAERNAPDPTPPPVVAPEPGMCRFCGKRDPAPGQPSKPDDCDCCPF